MSANLQFSVEDMKSPDRLERVLQQFRTAIQTSQPAMTTIQNALSNSSLQFLNSLATQLSPLVRNQLQATGASPINVTNTLPGVTSSAQVIVGTHATRLSNYVGSNIPPVGSVFFESDRNAIYISTSTVWTWAAGLFVSTFANAPTDLGTNDLGFTYYVDDYAHTAIWNGAAWELTDGGGGYFVPSAIALGTGYQICDGSTTAYLVNGSAPLSTASFTTPNLTVSGVYFVSGTPYSGSFKSAVAPTFTGTPTTTGNDGDVGVDVTPSGSTLVSTNPHTHTYTPSGTISLSGGDPVGNMTVLYYFRL